MKKTIITSVIAMGLLLTGAIAQQQGGQCAGGDMANMECCKSMQGMGQMQGMMPMMMPQTMAGHGDAAKLVDQLVASLASIEAEKNAKVRAEKLAAHGALLKELQTKIEAQNQMMQQHMGSMKADEDHKH